MVHIHHSQPLKIKFGTNHFLGSETFGPIQYREGVKTQIMSFDRESWRGESWRGQDFAQPVVSVGSPRQNF